MRGERALIVTMSHVTTPATPVIAPIPPLPQTQAKNSTTFRVPPLDGSMMLPDIWDWHREYSPKHPVFVYTQDDGSERVLNWTDVGHGLHRAGLLVRSRLSVSSEEKPVVAILAASGRQLIVSRDHV